MWGDILSAVGDFQYRGDIIINVEDILSTVGVFSTVGDTILCNLSTVGDIMIHVGDIMSTVGCSVLWGTQITKDFPPRY